MKFLVIGDVVGNPGLDELKSKLNKIMKKEQIDFCVINGENACGGRGIKEKELNRIFEYGADIVTMGNHLYYRKESAPLYKEVERLVIPANVLNLEGHGHVIVEKNNIKLAVINLLGKVGMGEVSNSYTSNPFKEVQAQIAQLKALNVDYIFVDFHAEATAEKRAMGFLLENDVTCVYGTHTHVQTSDEEIFKGGMAYITDIGMTGPIDSVLGLKKEIAVTRFLTEQKIQYECSSHKGEINGIIVTTDDETKKAIKIERIDKHWLLTNDLN